MPECQSCEAHVSPGEHYCGNCGMQITPSSTELKTVAAQAGDEENVSRSRDGREWANTLDDETPAIKDEAEAAPAAVHEPSGSLETTFVAPETDEPSAPLSSNSL